MRDMCDIVHYLMEEDFLRAVTMSERPLQTVSDMRVTLYRELYDRTYRHTVGAGETNEYV